MKAVEFCYWLQGYFEIHGTSAPCLDTKQTETVRNHLAMVFIHDIDPSYPQGQQEALNQAHIDPVTPSAIKDALIKAQKELPDRLKIGGQHPHDPSILYRC